MLVIPLECPHFLKLDDGAVAVEIKEEKSLCDHLILTTECKAAAAALAAQWYLHSIGEVEEMLQLLHEDLFANRRSYSVEETGECFATISEFDYYKNYLVEQFKAWQAEYKRLAL